MSMFKNAILATLTTGGIAMLSDLPNAWSASLAAGAFVATYAIPPFIQELRNLAGSARTALSKGRQKGGELARATVRTGADLAWALSPTNPDSNVPMGASMGFASSAAYFKLNSEADSTNRNAVVAAITVVGGIAGYYLPKFFAAKQTEATVDSKSTASKEKRNNRSTKDGDDASTSASISSEVAGTPPANDAAVASSENTEKKKRTGLRALLGGQ